MQLNKSQKIVSEEREAFFVSLYRKAFPAVSRYVSKMGGDLDEAKDIFQDALVIYYEKSLVPSFSTTNGERAYILGIAKHLWLKKYRDSHHTMSLQDSNVAMAIASEGFLTPSPGKVTAFLGASGQKCMEILKAFYYNKLPLHEIAVLFGYSGIRSATVQKYKCLEKVRDSVREKSLAYEDFIE